MIKRGCELNKSHIISTDEDPGLRIESFAVINLRGVSTNKTIICFIAMQTYKELSIIYVFEITTFKITSLRQYMLRVLCFIIGSPKMCVEIFTLARGARACIESTQFIIMTNS